MGSDPHQNPFTLAGESRWGETIRPFVVAGALSLWSDEGQKGGSGTIRGEGGTFVIRPFLTQRRTF